MLIMILESVPQSLRGELSRWMIEPRTGVFIGKVSGEVRDKLWDKCLESKKFGSVIQIWNSNNEQGFSARAYGLKSKKFVDLDGLILVKDIES
ncbi:MAG: type I-E CRISPR-associated endoribonuclease Cas2 [Methanomassiliicoccales archaeon]|nr:MAG: type I-E CRISPR-associated endoribonuclease Cas2 [Methanomassiliicoccales archaeon]